MNPTAQAVLDLIETGSVTDLVTFLHGLDDDSRRAVARSLPAHLSERRRGGFEAERRIWELAPLYRLAGAACFGGAEQVASWLNRRELTGVEPKADAVHVMSVLRDRPLEWRRDLAVRLVRRLRPARSGSTWRRAESLRAWDLAAALVIDTGVEPPENDAFVSGWVLRMVERQWMNQGTPMLAGDPLLGHMLPRLFEAAGVADGLDWGRWSEGHLTIIGELVELARTGRVPRQVLLDGCVSRFLTGGGAAEAATFVTMWRALRPEAAEIPVTDFVRVLPSASSPVVQLALEELRRSEALDTDLFAEAVQALTCRPEKKYVAAAVKWIADAPPAWGAAAVAALAPVFDLDPPSLRERAVRVAVKLAPHTAEPGRQAIREAATRLPADLRERLAVAFGPVDEPEPDPVAAPPLTATALPALPPPIASVAELAAELDKPLWPEDPARMERILAALVELTHRNRDAVVQGLQPWWQTNWRHPFEAAAYAYGISGFDEDDIPSLLLRCALAVVSPADSRKLTALLNGKSQRSEPAPYRFVQQRFREVISLFERVGTLPVLLATPTAPTGHVDAATLVTRMERLDGAEPLTYDFVQALLRLPRELDPDPAVRAEKLPSEAGRRLAACLRAGGLPDPDVTWGLESFDRPASYHQSLREAHARLAPPEGIPGPLAELWTLAPKPGYPTFYRNMTWWPPVMPSHREALAAHLLECLPWSHQVEAVAALAHNDGPAGIATASTIVIEMGAQLPAQRALAAEAILTLAAHGELPAADLGRAVGHMVRGEQVKLFRITAVLDEVTAAGAHAHVWTALAEAVPLLLPAPGEKARPGLGDLLKVAVRAAALTGARGELPGLAELAARKGSSLLLHEARRLHKTLSAGAAYSG
ncbi:DUF6493 family protein [Nonomuraea bangladeshensis]|uniref:DUF7824 domain-containing protein n=1 Tax=Nonomuraea bangladeshensis TaxID=404385 RepID=UPI0031E3C26E